MVVDFLATLFVTFCIGVATALVLGACVVLMTGEAHGAAPAKPRGDPIPSGIPAAAAELVLTHALTAKYVGWVPIDRISAAGPGPVAPQAGLQPGCSSTPTGARRGVSRAQAVPIFAASR